MRGAYVIYGRVGVNLQVRDHLEDITVYRGIILKWT